VKGRNDVIRRSSTQALRDAAVVFILILLTLTIRLDPSDAAVDLVPEAEAAEAGALLLPAGGPEAELDVLPLELSVPEVRVFTLEAGDPNGGGEERTICRIARSGNTIEARCSQVGDASSGAEAAAQNSAPCPLTARQHG
jgi:hypothetical protein